MEKNRSHLSPGFYAIAIAWVGVIPIPDPDAKWTEQSIFIACSVIILLFRGLECFAARWPLAEPKAAKPSREDFYGHNNGGENDAVYCCCPESL